MATTSKLDSTRKDKGKMIIAKPEITTMSDLRQIHCNKTIEAMVYRKWTFKHVHTRQPMKYCFILMDKQGTPMTLSKGTWMLINVQEIPSDDYPGQYFNFASYNELPSRPDVKHTILTDYVGRIHRSLENLIFDLRLELPGNQTSVEVNRSDVHANKTN
uniref:Uncharacterized protein n=1 Tax=Tanacetum cinerariifolium TaxID=118510 RepID=A0A6L2MV68_TANCI|nr:hypothetical protein [Tanacetum cinerariifolium]